MKPRKTIKGVFFDAGDTLFEPKYSIGYYYSQIAAEYGIELPADLLDQKFKSSFQKSPPLAFPNVTSSELRRLEFGWWRQVVQRVFDGIDFPQFDQFFEKLYYFFESEAPWQLFPETREVLENLQNKQITLGIISNFDSRLIPICEHLGIRDYFKYIVFSSREPFAKPAPEIFSETLSRAGLNPEASLYIGDSPRHDVQGPQKIGMKAILLDRQGKHSALTHLTKAKDLRDIYRYLNPI